MTPLSVYIDMGPGGQLTMENVHLFNIMMLCAQIWCIHLSGAQIHSQLKSTISSVKVLQISAVHTESLVEDG